MTHKGVLLDTSFFIRFLNDKDPLFEKADNYFKKFLEQEYELYISTISIAEFCVKGNISHLPLKNIRVLPFNIEHAERAGCFAKTVFDNKNELESTERKIIPNDTKLFAQADTEIQIYYYLSSDLRSKNVLDVIEKDTKANFKFVDLNVSF